MILYLLQHLTTISYSPSSPVITFIKTSVDRFWLLIALTVTLYAVVAFKCVIVVADAHEPLGILDITCFIDSQLAVIFCKHGRVFVYLQMFKKIESNIAFSTNLIQSAATNFCTQRRKKCLSGSILLSPNLLSKKA